MEKIDERVTIQADIDTVMGLLLSAKLIPRWYEGADAATASEGFPAPGSTLTTTYKVAGLDLKNTLTVVEYDHGTAIRYMIEGAIKGTFDWFISEGEGGVTVRHVVEYEMSGGAIGRLAMPLVHRSNVSNAKKTMQNLKALAER